MADAIQAGLGVPRSLWARNTLFMNAWNNAETAHASSPFAFNPWGNTRPTPGSRGGGSQGDIQSYPNFAAGVAANVATLRQGNMSSIVAALKNPNTTQSSFGQAVAASSWNPGGGARYANLIGGARTTNSNGDIGAATRAQAAASPSQAPATGTGPAPTAAGSCRFQWHIPVTPFGQSWDPCGDAFVGGLAMAGGVALMLAGVAVTVAALRDTGGGSASSKALAAAGTVLPAGKALTAAKAMRPAERQKRAQTKAAAEAKRTAPARAEARRDEVHQARLRRAESTAATRSARSTRGGSIEGPNAGRSTASIIAANKRRNAARDRAAAAREPVPF